MVSYFHSHPQSHLFLGLRYHELKKNHEVVAANMRGDPPQRPTSSAAAKWISDPVWKLLLSCWKKDPSHRKPMSAVATALEDIERSLSPGPLPA
jgi:hypothetical protein